MGDHLDTIGLRKACELVGGAELEVVTCLREHFTDGGIVECARIGESGTAVADDTDADAFALGADEVLDVALVHADVGLVVS